MAVKIHTREFSPGPQDVGVGAERAEVQTICHPHHRDVHQLPVFITHPPPRPQPQSATVKTNINTQQVADGII